MDDNYEDIEEYLKFFVFDDMIADMFSNKT